MYDVDFIISALAVRHSLADLRGNTRQRLHRLRECGLLAESEVSILDEAAEFLRALDHVIRLATGRAGRTLPVGEHARRATEELAAHVLGRRFGGGLEPELARIQQATREAYHRIGL
jgi:glutamine synthetase adenylyltransferase